MSSVANAGSTQASPVLQIQKRPAFLNPVKEGISNPIILSRSATKRVASDHDYARPSPEVHLAPPSWTVPIAMTTKAYDSNDRTNRVGKYIIGPAVGKHPVKSLQDYIARKEDTDEFYILRIYTCMNKNKKTPDEFQGQILLTAERCVLNRLVDMEGIFHCHELYGGIVQETFVNEEGVESKQDVHRIISVLDCYAPHDYSPKYANLTSLQSHVIKNKTIPESEAIRLFCKTVDIVERLHQRNVVHRDVKLGNLILDKDTGEVKLANFCLAKSLSSESALLTDQRGSPAYIAPDVIASVPYLGKPADMWSMGIVLYTMLFGQFPFYDQSPTELFRKIKSGQFKIPPNANVKDKTIELIVGLLKLDPKTRLTASQAKEMVESIIANENFLMMDTEDQVVPDIDTYVGKSVKKQNVCLPSSAVDLLVGQISEIYFQGN